MLLLNGWLAGQSRKSLLGPAEDPRRFPISLVFFSVLLSGSRRGVARRSRRRRLLLSGLGVKSSFENGALDGFAIARISH